MRLDNSREDQTLQQKADKDLEIKIQFEFNSPFSPQQNGKTECKFAT
jgi:hypothetical protein